MGKEKLRNDFIHNAKHESNKNEICIDSSFANDFFYYTLSFPKRIPHRELIEELKNKIREFMHNKKIKTKAHILVVGIGNDSHTADSIGPLSLKFLHVNSHLLRLGLSIKGYTVSSLEPGVLGQTGIETSRIVKSVVDEIKPDCLLIVDSFITDDAYNIGRTIYLTDEGITPGSGIKGNNETISELTIGLPTFTIGIPTAVEIFLNGPKGKTKPYLLSPSDIDLYVREISEIIGLSIDEVLMPNAKF